jgi:hypothetical protein
MSRQSKGKLNQLLQAWPRGAVVTTPFLHEKRVYRQLVTKYLRNGWIGRVGRGAYFRCGDTVDWRGGLYALQAQLGMTVHVGGRTALELLGLAHFLPFGQQRRVTLISDRHEHLPTWFKKYKWDVDVDHHSLSLFSRIPSQATTHLDCGGFEIALSSAERAVMEQMCLVQTNSEIEYVLKLMEGLTTLRPNVVQLLLESCTSIKVKRLFLWSAEAVGHGWFDRLDPTKVDLGKGKRQLYKDGRFDQKYRITVPRQEDFTGV